MKVHEELISDITRICDEVSNIPNLRTVKNVKYYNRLIIELESIVGILKHQTNVKYHINMTPFQSLKGMIDINYLSIAGNIMEYIPSAHHGFMIDDLLYMPKESLVDVMNYWYQGANTYNISHILDDLEKNNCIKLFSSKSGRTWRTHHFVTRQRSGINRRYVVIYLNKLKDANTK